MRVLRVRAELQAPVATAEEIHLDALVYAAMTRGLGITRADPAAKLVDADMPIARWRGVWMASAWILPDCARRRSETFTKRKDPGDLWYLQKNHNRSSGPGKDYMLRHQTVETPWAEWLVVSTERCAPGRTVLRQMVRRLTAIGRYRRQGFGRVARWSFARAEDVSPEQVLVAGGRARRHLPYSVCEWAEANEVGEVAPPYWHPGRRAERVRAGWRCELAEVSFAC